MVDLDFDPLSSEPREKEMPVVVNPKDPSKGTVIVTLRDIPRGRYAAFTSAYQSALAALGKVLSIELEATEKLLLTNGTFDELIASVTAELINVKQLASAWQLLFIARKELVTWGVAGHNPESFKQRGTPIPFESVLEAWEGVSYSLCSGRMIGLYSHPRVGIMAPLADAVRAFNDDRWATPEEIWEKAKKAAEPAKKEGEAKAVPPKKVVGKKR